ncbi:NmrA family NAD(P)-binding protein [Streptomyces phaeochromogenes]|nr:NmrA family NAD(P)-binding protein [Streptomyces phaeochromogenes]
MRDPSGHRARSLSAAGVEIVRGDLGDPESLRAAFSDAHGVFSVQPNSGQAGAEVTDEDEVRFGTTVADIRHGCGSLGRAGGCDNSASSVRRGLCARCRRSGSAAVAAGASPPARSVTAPGAGPASPATGRPSPRRSTGRRSASTARSRPGPP